MTPHVHDVDGTASILRDKLIDHLTDEGHSQTVEQRVADYMRDNTGRAFETYAAGRFDAGSITGDDLVAVTLLSMEIRRGTTSGITPAVALEIERSEAINALLRQIPTDRSLHTLNEAEFDRWLGPGSAADALYAQLKAAGLPRVASHKLLARKRPNLIPIRDTVVETALGLKNSDLWWRPWWQALSGDPDLVRLIQAVPLPATAQHLSLLRVADIAVWTAARAQAS